MAKQRRIGIMGLGVLGSDIAGKLTSLQFEVSGWSRTPKKLEVLATYCGDTEFVAFLKRSDILICLLPLTPETKGLLDQRCFSILPRGAYVINVARGDHLIEQDLLSALDSGQLSGATLDVFSNEPLPEDHPFWSHPKITITPHVASIVNPNTAVRVIVENMQRQQVSKGVVDLDLGY